MNLSLESLKEQVSNLSLYDLKAGVRRVQNAVMNYTEMEAKVREATNNEPWGCPTTMMQEIANGTHNYQLLNEIMPMIYKRFTEKAAEEWRQIYKALQLLEFLIKNGSERVIDDARSHLTLLKMLRQFHFIDQNGKDQGINVRNRAKELAELLSDVDRIRAERKKARATRNKYSGVEGGSGLGSGLSVGANSKYSGFGNQDRGYRGSEYGGYSGGVYGDGGGFGGQSNEFQDTGSRTDKFEEYDEYDEGAVATPVGKQTDTASPAPKSKRAERASKTPESPKKKDPDFDLFSFDDPVPAGTTSLAPAKPSNVVDDDEFDDFQSAAPAPQIAASSSLSTPTPALPTATSIPASLPQFTPLQPVSAPKGAVVSDGTIFSSISPPANSNTTSVNYSAFSPPTATQQSRPTAYQGSQPNYFASVSAPNVQSPTMTSNTSTKAASANAPDTADAFGALWSSASVGIKKTSAPLTSGPALGQLAKEKASAGIWGTSGTSVLQQKSAQCQQQLGGVQGDLLG